MHAFAEALFQILLEILAVFFGEQARERGCGWAVLSFVTAAAVAWIVLAVLGS